MMANDTLLAVEGLTLEVARTGMQVVKGISFTVAPGELLGIVGESGSGKTMAARAAMRLEPPAVRRIGGSIRFEGREITSMPFAELRRLRGARIGMVFQEPMTSLNPSMTVGRQLEEGLALHRRDLTTDARRALVLDMLERVGIAEPIAALSAYPHQFSGGMRQRIMLASVMLLRPALLIADEPTTALDAVIQREVLELMVDLTRDNGTAVLMISHDLSMVARYTDRVIVMQEGAIVEEGPTRDLLQHPRHPYTRKLLAAMPRRGPARDVGRASVPIVEVRDLVVEYAGRQGFLRRAAPKRALHGIALHIDPGEVVAVVGGSGSGKTTLGRAIAGMIRPAGGDILFSGRPINGPRTGHWADYRLNCQMVFQDPYSSLDPRMKTGALVGEALRLVPGMSRPERRARVAEVLDEVGLGRFRGTLSARTFRRAAPARGDCPGDRAPAGVRYCRRTRLGSRHHRACAGARPLRKAAAAPRLCLSLHQPRPRSGRAGRRPRGGDAARPHRGGRRPRRGFRRAAPRLHAPAPFRGPGAGSNTRRRRAAQMAFRGRAAHHQRD